MASAAAVWNSKQQFLRVDDLTFKIKAFLRRRRRSFLPGNHSFSFCRLLRGADVLPSLTFRCLLLKFLCHDAFIGLKTPPLSLLLGPPDVKTSAHLQKVFLEDSVHPSVLSLSLSLSLC